MLQRRFQQEGNRLLRIGQRRVQENVIRIPAGVRQKMENRNVLFVLRYQIAEITGKHVRQIKYAALNKTERDHRCGINLADGRHVVKRLTVDRLRVLRHGRNAPAFLDHHFVADTHGQRRRGDQTALHTGADQRDRAFKGLLHLYVPPCCFAPIIPRRGEESQRE